MHQEQAHCQRINDEMKTHTGVNFAGHLINTCQDEPHREVNHKTGQCRAAVQAAKDNATENDFEPGLLKKSINEDDTKDELYGNRL